MDWRETRTAAGKDGRIGPGRAFWLGCVITACAAFLIPLGVRALEIPIWNNPAFKLGNEYLLATQDAYHWIAGAEGFEFGAGHPMSVLIRSVSLLSGMAPANVGFWLPLFFGSLLSVGVFVWAAALGFPCAGMIAGALASLSPGFLARTLLGYCDTDLVILLFGLLLGFVPMLWLRRWLTPPAAWAMEVFAALHEARSRAGGNTLQSALALLRMRLAAVPSARRHVALFSLSPAWLCALILSGLWGYSTQSWHSYFPYAVRFSALLLPLLIVAFGPKGGKRLLFAGALCHLLPLLLGLIGVLAACLLAFAQVVFIRTDIAVGVRDARTAALRRRFAAYGACCRALLRTKVLVVLWLAVAACLVDTAVWATLARSVGSYVKTTGEVAGSSADAADPLVYPAVSQSISEVQNLSFGEFLQYFHRVSLFAVAGIAGFGCLLLFYPQTAYLALMLAVGFSSLKLGGRMAMFASPVLALGVCVSVAQMLSAFFGPGVPGRIAAVARFFQFENPFVPVRWIFCFCLTIGLVWPAAGMIPEISSGPIISRDQARALAFLRNNSPKDSVIWDWWDWGYAAHHFAQRKTIADGARHGGPSLYLPAAVYTTNDPHFARQLMAYTSEHGGEAGDGFDHLSGSGMAERLADLDSGKIAPAAKSKQYLVVSTDLITLGFWISTYGTWDFKRKESKGYFITSIPQAVQYALDTGVVLIKGQEPSYAASIDVFSANDLKRQSYYRGTDARFVFNTMTGDKFLMRNDLYNTLMYQLLVSKPDDTRFNPYFKLVYDTAQVKIYEML